jgi:uncharacterized damage-inducible protein DinB
MLTNSLSKLYIRDLDKLIVEINLFEDETKLWDIVNGITNSAGNLTLHLVGNLMLYIGNNLGGYAYTRDRPAEFSSKNIPKNDLIEKIEQLKGIISDSFQKLTTDDLERIYPTEVLGYEMTTEYFLIHLLAHLEYHLGQINYLRRFLS